MYGLNLSSCYDNNESFTSGEEVIQTIEILYISYQDILQKIYMVQTLVYGCWSTDDLRESEPSRPTMSFTRNFSSIVFAAEKPFNY